MAKSKKNVVMHGASGNIGDLLRFVQRYGKTYIGKIPELTKVRSAKQLAVIERFKKATRYALTALANIDIRALYEVRAEGEVKAYNLAIADYFIAPSIGDFVTDDYTGRPGNTLVLDVNDDTKVSSVIVTITAPDGSVVETGAAVQVGDSPAWTYTVTAVNNTVPGSSIKITAKDLPGNISEKTAVI